MPGKRHVALKKSIIGALNIILIKFIAEHKSQLLKNIKTYFFHYFRFSACIIIPHDFFDYISENFRRNRLADKCPHAFFKQLLDRVLLPSVEQIRTGVF